MKLLVALVSAILVFQHVSSIAILQPSLGILETSVQTTSECKTSDECRAGMCCVVSNPFIMSKRQLLITSLDLYSTGKCQPYVREGEDCFSSGFGSCGCEPGTTCVKVADLFPSTFELQPLKEKMLIYKPPGIYNCVRK